MIFVLDWVPITTPDGWVLIPSVTPITPPTTIINETIPTTTTPLTPSSVEPLSTFIPLLTFSTEPSSEVPPTPTTFRPDSSSMPIMQNTSLIINSTISSTSEGEKITTAMPGVTETPGNLTSTEVNGSTATMETTSSSSSSSATSTEVISDGKPVNMSDFTDGKNSKIVFLMLNNVLSS